MKKRTTINIDENLLQRAKDLTGIESQTELVHAGLKELIQRHVQQRLIQLQGTQKKLKPVPRRRSAS